MEHTVILFRKLIVNNKKQVTENKYMLVLIL